MGPWTSYPWAYLLICDSLAGWRSRKRRRPARGGFEGQGQVCQPAGLAGTRSAAAEALLPILHRVWRPGLAIRQRGFSRRHHRRRPTGGRRASGSAHLRVQPVPRRGPQRSRAAQIRGEGPDARKDEPERKAQNGSQPASQPAGPPLSAPARRRRPRPRARTAPAAPGHSRCARTLPRDRAQRAPASGRRFPGSLQRPLQPATPGQTTGLGRLHPGLSSVRRRAV